MAKTTNQVRIIGGHFKRRQLSFVDGEGLRPTPDRLRETIFNWLMADTLEATVLDMCAGSGVLGFEALSRGAKHATFIEPNTAQAKALSASAKHLALNPTQYTIKNTTAQYALPTLTTCFDIIFIDPPYALNLWQTLIDLSVSHNLIHQDTKIYLESNRPLDELTNTLKPIKQTKVGQVYAGIYTTNQT